MDGKIASASSDSELEQQLRRAAKIARLELPEGELEGLLRDARAIFEKFSEIRKLKPHPGAEPGTEPESGGFLREDGPPITSESTVSGILGQVPKKKEGEGRLIKAPKSL